MRQKFYTYVYTDLNRPGRYTYPDLPFSFLYLPIYVGKGTAKRYCSHFKISRDPAKRSLINRALFKIRKSGLKKPQPFFITENVNENTAYELEKKLISAIGRRILKSGPLWNVQEGGGNSSEITERVRSIRSNNMRAFNQKVKDEYGSYKNYLIHIHGEEKALEMISNAAKKGGAAASKSPKVKAAAIQNGLNNKGKKKSEKGRKNIKEARRLFSLDADKKREAALKNAATRGRATRYSITPEIQAFIIDLANSGKIRKEIITLVKEKFDIITTVGSLAPFLHKKKG